MKLRLLFFMLALGVLTAESPRSVQGRAGTRRFFARAAPVLWQTPKGLCGGEKKSSSAQRQQVQLIDFRAEGAEVLIAGEKAGSQRWISADCLAEE